jgi:hypothetical protein
MTGRTCLCGQPIVMTDKMAAFGRKHGRDLATWPAKCLTCIVDSTITMFDEVEKRAPMPMPAPPNQKRCAICETVLGSKFYSAVPKFGDLCLTCHATKR